MIVILASSEYWYRSPSEASLILINKIPQENFPHWFQVRKDLLFQELEDFGGSIGIEHLPRFVAKDNGVQT